MKIHSFLLSASLLSLAFACKEAPKAASMPASGNASLTTEQIAAFAPVLEDYERLRALLANDKLEGLAALSASISARATELGGSFPEAHKPRLGALAARSTELAKASADSMKATRLAFGELSRELVQLLAASDALKKGRHVFECGMADGYQKWVQPAEEIENPYMGQAMLTCGSASSWD